AETVVARVGADNKAEVLATTILAYALSTLMTGAVFLALGYFKELNYTWETFKFLFLDSHVFALWASAFGLALLLRGLQYRIKHPFLVPVFFMMVPSLFYVIVGIAGFDYAMLREKGW
ncbi:hypothetical protein BGW38_009720, partial [Lunasporangiospora selenospora]